MPLLKFGFTSYTTLIVLSAILSMVAISPVDASERITTETSTVAAANNKRSLEQASEALRIAMLEGDRERLDAVLHDRLTYMHSSGRSQTKADLLEQMAGQHFFASLDYTDQIIDVVDNTGVVIVTVDQVKNLTEGKTRGSRIKVMYSWVHSAGKWQLLGRTSAIIYSPLKPACNPVKSGA